MSVRTSTAGKEELRVQLRRDTGSDIGKVFSWLNSLEPRQRQQLILETLSARFVPLFLDPLEDIEENSIRIQRLDTYIMSLEAWIGSILHRHEISDPRDRHSSGGPERREISRECVPEGRPQTQLNSLEGL